MHKTNALHFHHGWLKWTIETSDEINWKRRNGTYKEYRRRKSAFTVSSKTCSRNQIPKCYLAPKCHMSRFRREKLQRPWIFQIFELLVSTIASRTRCRSPNPSSHGLRSRNPPILHHFAANFRQILREFRTEELCRMCITVSRDSGTWFGCKHNRKRWWLLHGLCRCPSNLAQREETERLKPGLHLVDPGPCHVAVVPGWMSMDSTGAYEGQSCLMALCHVSCPHGGETSEN